MGIDPDNGWAANYEIIPGRPEKIVKELKAAKMKKVQAAIQGEELRISGKKRDDLQAAISLIKNMDLNQPLQYVNFRD